MILDKEQEEMESAARVAAPRNTDSYDYANYHTIRDVSTHTLYTQYNCYLLLVKVFCCLTQHSLNTFDIILDSNV